MDKLSLEQVMDIMELKSGSYGFRGASKRDLEILQSDEYLDASLDLWDERDCNFKDVDRLNGTSAICITEYMDMGELKNRYNYTKGYADNHHGTGVVLFVYGDSSEYGDDDREVVLRCDFSDGAKVIAEVVL